MLADLARVHRRRPGAAAGQPRRDLPRRPAHGGAAARARASSRPTSRCWNSRPGIACLTTACRRMPAIVAQRMTALARLARVKGRERPAVAAHDRQRHPAARAAARGRSPANRFRPRRATCCRWRASRNGSSSTASTAPRPCASPATMRCAAASSICSRPAWPSRCGSISSATRWRSIRSFDPETQRTTDELRALDLVPMAEFQLTTDTIRLFRTGYVAAFGAAGPDDVLYEAVSEGRRHAGMEHWLPLFHQRLETLFDYLAANAARARATRRGGGPRAPGADRRLLSGAQGRARSGRRRRALQAAAAGPALPQPKPNGATAWSNRRWPACRRSPLPRAPPMRSRSPRTPARNFAAERSEPGSNVFEAVTKHVEGAAGGRQARHHRAVERGLARAHGPRARRARAPQSHAGRFLAAGARFVAAGDRARRARRRDRLRDRRCRAHQRAGHFGRAPGAPAPAVEAARRTSSPR